MEEKIKIEILFPEFCNLYGDIQNMKYLKKCLPKAKFYETAFVEEPKFLTEDITFIYMGPMTERMQESVIKKLMQYKNKIVELIDKNTIFLMTGNAIEIFGKYIENEDGTKIEGLNIFNFYAKRQMMNRFNNYFLGIWDNIKIVGFKSQFSFIYGNNEKEYFAKAEKGEGINCNTKYEGIHKNNFIGTNLLGPILILNPLLTKKIIEIMGIDNPKLPFEEDLMNAYKQRIKEFEKIK